MTGLGYSFLLWITVFFLFSPPSVHSWEQTGIASWYGGIFQGRQTSNGEIYDTYGFTCAHKTLPFGTILIVTNLKNNRTVRVRVNDRGPFVEGRIIDLTYSAAKKLDMIRDGTAPVNLVVDKGAMPVMRFKVRIGAWRNLETARQHKIRLEKLGFKPIAVMNDRGITGLSVSNIDEEDVFMTVSRLKKLGYIGLLISQISE